MAGASLWAQVAAGQLTVVRALSRVLLCGCHRLGLGLPAISLHGPPVLQGPRPGPLSNFFFL